MTALNLLALVGSDRAFDGRERSSEFGSAVAICFDPLTALQRDDGSWDVPEASDPSLMQAWACLAFAELVACGPPERYKAAAAAALTALVRMQQADGSWRMAAGCAIDHATVTGWAALALMSATDSGLPVDARALGRAIGFLRSPLDSAVRADTTDRVRLAAIRCAVVGAHQRMLMRLGPIPTGLGVDEETRRCLIDNPPTIAEDATRVDLNAWLLGFIGAWNDLETDSRIWDAWHPTIATCVVHAPAAGCVRGSFDPVGPWSKEGGRCWSTVMAQLVLLHYYRFPRAFGARRGW